MGRHCCEQMRAQLEQRCAEHADLLDCPDVSVVYLGKFDEYLQPAADSESAGQVLSTCPWCGSTLPQSRRDAWFDALDARGLSPWGDKLPPEFESDRWWRGR